MTDRPEFHPTALGVEDVFRRARARRVRQGLVGGCSVGVCAVVVVAVAWFPRPGGNADRIGVTTVTPTQTPSAAVSPRPTSAPTAAGAVRPDAGSVAGAGRSPGDSTALGLPGPASSPTPTAPTHRKSAPAPIHRSTVTYPGGCDPSYDVVGWCVLYTGPSSARRKHPVTFSVELCRVPTSGDGTTSFGSTREVDLQLTSASGSTAWQAGQGEHYRSPGPSVTVKAGSCLRWTSVWDTIGPDGFYAPPGGYDISYGVDSSDASFGSGVTFTLTD